MTTYGKKVILADMEDINEVQNVMNEVTEHNQDNLVNKLTTMQEDIDNIEILVNNVKSTLDNVNGSVATINTISNNVSTINTNVTANKSTLGTMSNVLTTVNTNVSNINSRITDTRAGYLDLLANGTNGLAAIKNAISNINAVTMGIPKVADIQYIEYSTAVTAGQSATILNITGPGKIRILNINKADYNFLYTFIVDGNTSTCYDGTANSTYQHSITVFNGTEYEFRNSFVINVKNIATSSSASNTGFSCIFTKYSA